MWTSPENSTTMLFPFGNLTYLWSMGLYVENMSNTEEQWSVAPLSIIQTGKFPIAEQYDIDWIPCCNELKALDVVQVRLTLWTPWAPLVTPLLDGKNYHSWSRSMRREHKSYFNWQNTKIVSLKKCQNC